MVSVCVYCFFMFILFFKKYCKRDQLGENLLPGSYILLVRVFRLFI